MAEKKHQLSLLIRAVDKATAPLRAINERIHRFTAPVREVNNRFRALAKSAGLPQLVAGFSGVGSAVGRVGKELGALAFKFAGLAAAAGFALFRIVKGAMDAGDELATMADRVRLTVDEYAQLRFAAEQADVSQESFNNAMDGFNKRLGEAKAGTGSLASLLKVVSPRLLEQLKGAKGNAAAFDLMTKAVVALEDPNKRAALAMAAFGRPGKEMVALLGQGSEEIQKQGRRYLELAGSQEEFARGAGGLDNAVRETATAFEGLRNRALGKLFPVLEKLANWLTDFTAKHGDTLVAWAEETATAIMAWVDGGGLERLVEDVKGFITQAGALVEKLGGWKVIAAAVAGIIAGPLLAAVGGLITSVVTLVGAIGLTPIGWLLVGLAAIAAVVALVWANFDTLRTLFAPVFEPLIEAVSELWAKLKELWELLEPVLLPALKAVGAVLGAVVLKAIDAIAIALRAVVWLVTKFVEGISSGAKQWKTLFTEGPGALLSQAANTSPLDVAKKVFGFGGAGGGPPVLDPERAAGPVASSSSAKVSVEFANLPAGARVNTDSSSNADLDVSAGYALMVP